MLLQHFYHGLHGPLRESIDNASGGMFLKKTAEEANIFLHELSQNAPSWGGGQNSGKGDDSLEHNPTIKLLMATVLDLQKKMVNDEVSNQLNLARGMQAFSSISAPHLEHQCVECRQVEHVNVVYSNQLCSHSYEGDDPGYTTFANPIFDPVSQVYDHHAYFQEEFSPQPTSQPQFSQPS